MIVVPAKAGTHTPWRLCWETRFDGFRATRTFGVMGPGLRRDDV